MSYLSSIENKIYHKWWINHYGVHKVAKKLRKLTNAFWSQWILSPWKNQKLENFTIFAAILLCLTPLGITSVLCKIILASGHSPGQDRPVVASFLQLKDISASQKSELIRTFLTWHLQGEGEGLGLG